MVNGSLVRVRLGRPAADWHTFIFAAHHIICDGWSIDVILDEFLQLCALAPWTVESRRHCSCLALPASRGQFLVPLLSRLKFGLEVVSTAVASGKLTVDDDAP